MTKEEAEKWARDNGYYIFSKNHEWLTLEGICLSCGEKRTNDRHDDCIKNLKGIKYACCGHNGVFKREYQSYLVFYNNEYMRFDSTKELKEYVSSNCVFGWIGHSVRKVELDKIIEDGLRLRGLSSSKMYNWISSSDGRHFGDSLSGLTLQEQIKEINKKS